MSLWKSKKTVVTGTFSYLDAGGEQTVFEITGVQRGLVKGILLDLANITLNGTVKLYSKIDGTNYRLLMASTFNVLTDPDGFFPDVEIPVNQDFKLTYTESADEGAARAIPYNYILTD